MKWKEKKPIPGKVKDNFFNCILVKWISQYEKEKMGQEKEEMLPQYYTHPNESVAVVVCAVSPLLSMMQHNLSRSQSLKWNWRQPTYQSNFYLMPRSTNLPLLTQKTYPLTHPYYIIIPSLGRWTAFYTHVATINQY